MSEHTIVSVIEQSIVTLFRRTKHQNEAVAGFVGQYIENLNPVELMCERNLLELSDLIVTNKFVRAFVFELSFQFNTRLYNSGFSFENVTEHIAFAACAKIKDNNSNSLLPEDLSKRLFTVTEINGLLKDNPWLCAVLAATLCDYTLLKINAQGNIVGFNTASTLLT